MCYDSVRSRVGIHAEILSLNLRVESPWPNVQCTVPFVVLPSPGNLMIVVQQSLREFFEMKVMEQLKVTVEQLAVDVGGD